MFNNPMYYNPFKHSMSSFNRRINWSNLLTNTQKTLNVINQAIPVYYQIKPIYNNAKTMLRMVNALKDDNKNIIHDDDNKKTSPSGPVFFT